MEAIITAIIGAVVGVVGAYFAFSTKKVEADKEVKLAELETKKDCGTTCKLIEEEKKKWEAKEEELKDLLSQYAKNWADATNILEEQKKKIEELEKRIGELEKREAEWEKKEKEWQKKENEYLKKLFEKK